MERRKHNRQSGEHKKAKVAAKIGAGLGLAGLGAAAAYYARKRRLKELQSYEMMNATQEAAVGHEAGAKQNMSERQQRLVAEAAVRVFFATTDTAEVITPATLFEMLDDDIEDFEFTEAIQFLHDNRLIETRDITDPRGNPRSGYRALPALARAVHEAHSVLLADAQAKVVEKGLNQASSF